MLHQYHADETQYIRVTSRLFYLAYYDLSVQLEQKQKCEDYKQNRHFL